MSDVQSTMPEADTSALQASEVAAPQTPETETPELPAEEAPKTFTQEELDRAISRRLTQAERKWQREQAQRVAETPIYDPNADPELDRIVEDRVAQRITQREQQAAQAKIFDSYAEREETARDKYDDFDEVAYNPRLPVTEVMTQAIAELSAGPDVAYYLGQNMAEARRISQLTPIQQVAALGRIEAKLADAPPVSRKTSSAPPPIAPVTPNGNRQTFDTTDPRSMQMSTSEWIAAEEARIRKRLQGSR